MSAPQSAIFALAWELTHPWMLLLLPVAGLPWLLARRARRGGRDVARLNVMVEVLAILTLIIAIAGVRLTGASRDAPVLLLQDASGSVRGQPNWTPPIDVPLRVFRFGRNLTTTSAARPKPGTTNLSPALQLASAISPAPPAVIVRSDGRFRDAWASAADALAGRGLPLAVVPMVAPPADARIAWFDARRTPDGNAVLTVTVSSNAALQRTLILRQERPVSRTLVRRPVTLRAGDSATTRLTVSLAPEQGGRFTAVLEGSDAFPENDMLTEAVLPRTHRTALIGLAEDINWLAAALDDVDMLAVEEIPDAMGSGAPFSAVVVVDPTGEGLPVEARKVIADYTRRGGGLVVVGSGPRRSPADEADPLAEVLPISFDPWRRSALDIRILLDASGSMGEREDDGSGRSPRRFDQAVEAVMAIGRHLAPADRLGVWTFADEPRRRYGPNVTQADLAAVRRSLRPVQPAGATDAGKALTEALAQPIAADANGLVILMTDLRTRQFDVDRLADGFEDRDASLAVVVVGEDAPRHEGALDLRRLAERLDAPLVRTDSLAGLAKVFASFVKRSRRDALRVGRFRLVSDGPVFGLSDANWPTVRRYLQGQVKESARTLIATASSGDPVVARWRAGSGRAACIALQADVLNPTRRWKELVGAAVRWVRRPVSDSRFTADLQRGSGRLVVMLKAMEPDGNPINGLSLQVRVVAANTPSRMGSTDLLQVAPGSYRGVVTTPSGPLRLTVTDTEGATMLRQAVGETISPEYAELGADRASLQLLADRLGGRLIVRESVLTQFLRQARGRRWIDLTWILLLAATGLMLLDWLVARIARRAG